MRWLLDEGLPRSTAGVLNCHGQDAIHVGDIGLAGGSDRLIVAEARKQARSIITLDADFHGILAETSADGPSVVRIREEGLKAPALASIILRIAERFHQEIASGCVISYRSGRARFRKLPL